MAKEFECELDGVLIRGDSEDDLIASVERHIAESHPDLVGKVSREQILAAVKDA